MSGTDASGMQGRCHPFAFWDETGKDFADLARKIANDFPDSELSCYPTCGLHPLTVMRISDAGLLALRQSSFLFGRKFADDDLHMPNYARIVLSSVPPTDIKQLSTNSYSASNSYS